MTALTDCSIVQKFQNLLKSDEVYGSNETKSWHDEILNFVGVD